MLSIAVPVVLAELGWMAMGVVDTMMVGRIDAESIGGVGIGRALFFTVMVFGMGLLFGLDTLVSQACGAGDLQDARNSLMHGVMLAVALALPVALVLRATVPWLEPFGIEPGVRAAAGPYVLAMSWSALPFLLFTSLRRYLQAVNRVRAVMIALISANVVNFVANWAMIFGHLGMPALGAEGAGWATCISGVYLTGFLGFATWLHGREANVRSNWRIEPRRLRRLLALGFPAAFQLLVEMGAFAAGTALAGRLDPASSASHQIALVAISVAFMVPLGLSSAAAVRVGQALGRGEAARARNAGWTALALGAVFMSVAALAFVVFPQTLLRSFTTDTRVLTTGVTLLGIAALFQLFDGAQVIVTGALRGAGRTRAPLVWNLIGHWLLGLPVGYWLCFVRGWGVVGLWTGWLFGLTLLGAALLLVWWRTALDFPRAGVREARMTGAS